ncbi:MAG: GNAT family N-acetyltransferase [Cyanothece sp. SIO1E1]|nr:GNAT family N-acetyltransferase [Cyanothece sp. SIO1E1]
MTLSNMVIRSAAPADTDVLFELIQALAAYAKLSHQVTGNAAALKAGLFGPRPYGEAILAESAGQAVGFALFFYNFSTFLTQPGIYLEDLFVLPNYRSHGIGKALLAHVAKLAIERNCGRFEWSVLDWNQPAIGFYQRMGADVLPDWRICRVTGAALSELAARCP